MRSLLALVVASGCVSGNPPTDGPTADANVGHVAILGSCAHPLTDGAIAFPDTAAGAQSSMRELEMFNDGAQVLQSTEGLRWSIEGPDAAEFSVEGGARELTNRCTFHWMIPQPFAPGSSCLRRIEFRPVIPGPKTAFLHVTYDSGGASLDQMFSIHATAVAAPATLIASVPDFFVGQPTLTAPPPAGFRITNAGTANVDLGDPIVLGPFFLGMENCPTTLTPGAACDVAISGGQVSGCPIGTFTTTTAALTVQLSAHGVPASLDVSVTTGGSVHIAPLGLTCTATAACTIPLSAPPALTLTAEPDPGGHFLGWIDPTTGGLHSCGAALTCMIPAGFQNLHLIAVFASASAKAINVTIAGTGSVSWNGYPPLSCTSSCTFYAEPGTSPTLSASSPGSFVGWSGDCTGTGFCNLGTVVNDRAVTATFSP